MKLNKSLIITLFLFTLSSMLNAQYEKALNSFAGDTQFSHASISISIVDLSTGKVLAGLNENMALGSASVMKLVTTAAALEILGPDYTFKTRIGYTGKIDSEGILHGYIIIKGGGDPALGSERFEEHYIGFMEKWCDAIVTTGIKEVNGRVIADASIFNYHPVSGGWSWADLGNYYGAGAHGLSINDNMYRIHFKTGAGGSRPELVRLDPEVPGLIIKNLLVAEGDSDQGYVYIEPYGSFAEIRGSIPVNRNDFTLKASIPDPPQFSASLFDSTLRNNGIYITLPPSTLRLNDIAADERQHNSAVVLTTTSSPTLDKIVSVTNSESINLFAENLLRMISLSDDTDIPGEINHGIEVIYKLLEEKGIGSNGLYMRDGSGLSRYNAVSSAFIVKLLTYMRRESELSKPYFSSLPKPGEEGTLKDYFKDPVFKGRLSAKSGTATRIRNYAGYLQTISGKEYAFAVLVNNFDCTSSEVTAKVEALLKTIIEMD